MADVSAAVVGDECIDLPPGFRFHPTDEEIIKFYLTQKVLNNSFSSRAIAEADLNKTEPWDLPRKAKMGEKECYFFCQRDRKYPTGMRTNRATESGYWKATGKDKEIYQAKGCLVGMRKTLVFYRGRAPKGEKTNWVMHEYRLEGKFSYHSHSRSAEDEWVVCRVFHKSSGLRKSPTEDLLDYSILPPLSDPPYFSNEGSKGEFKGTTTTSRALDGIQASHFSNGIKDEGDKKSSLPNQGNFYNPPQNPFTSFQTSLANSLWSFSGSVNLDYLNNTGSAGLIGPTDERYGSKIQFKVDQVSNQSIVSQDTGVSTDQTPEISSHHSIKEIDNNRCYEDLECLWNY